MVKSTIGCSFAGTLTVAFNLFYVCKESLSASHAGMFRSNSTVTVSVWGRDAATSTSSAAAGELLIPSLLREPKTIRFIFYCWYYLSLSPLSPLLLAPPAIASSWTLVPLQLIVGLAYIVETVQQWERLNLSAPEDKLPSLLQLSMDCHLINTHGWWPTIHSQLWMPHL